MEWNGDKFRAMLIAAFKQANMATAREAVNLIKGKLNQGGGGPFSKNGAPSAPGTPPHKSTGNLARSFFAHDGDGISGYVSTNSKYAMIHEFGGTILPKGKYLVFPVTIEGRRHLKKHNGSIREALADDAVFIRKNLRSSGLLAFTTRGKRQKLVLLYALKTSVKMPARPYIVPALNDGKQALAEAWFGTAMDRIVGSVVRST